MRSDDVRGGAVSPGVGATRRTFGPAPLAVPGYRRLWRGGLVYYHAYWFEIVATGWTVLLLTGSPLAVGLVGFCRTLPMLVFGLLLGALADRLRETSLLLAVQCAGALAATGLAALFLLGRADVRAICPLVAVIGCGWACDFSARRALVAQFHGPARVANALSLETMTMLGSKIAATALAGGLLALGGARLAYGWLALAYLAGIAAALAVRRHDAPAARLPMAAISILTLARLGWATAVRTPVVRAVLLVTVAMNVLVFPYQQLIAVIAGDILAVGSGQMGLLAGGDGIGGIIVAGLLTARAKGPRQGAIFLGGALGVSLLLLALAFSRSFPLSFLLQIALGACAGAFGAMQAALIVGATDAEGRARALGMLAMAIGTAPLGIVLAGALSGAIGPTATLAGMATLALVLVGGLAFGSRADLLAPAPRR
jgi:hypothetical protein